MLAYHITEIRLVARAWMLVWTRWAQGAVPLEVSFACWTVWRETVAVGLEEEGREGEGVLGSLMLEDLTRQVFRPRAL